jgi:lysozyme
MLVSFEKYVDSYCVDSITQNEFDALVSFAYNLGPANLKASTLLKKVNANPNDESIRLEFMKWVKAGGKTLKGLVRRREAEADLYFKK